MKFNHYFDQHRFEKKDGECKINEHKEKGNDGERDSSQQITRWNKITRKNSNLAKKIVNNIKQLPTEQNINCFIIGDSIIKNIAAMGVSRDHTAKIRPHPAVTSIDMCDYIELELRHQPDVIILHCGTNDISNGINTPKKLKKLLKEIEGHTQKVSSCHT